MIRIDLRPNAKFPWGSLIKVVALLCFCSVMGMAIYLSWDPLAVYVKKIVKTMKDPDSIEEPFENNKSVANLSDTNSVLDSFVKKDSSQSDEIVTELIGKPVKYNQPIIAKGNTVLDDKDEEDKRASLLQARLKDPSVEASGVFEELKFSGDCHNTFEIIANLSNFMDLELLVCRDMGTFEISGTIDEGNDFTKFNAIAEQYFDDLDIVHWKESNKKIFFLMTSFNRKKKDEKRVVLDKVEISDVFLKARELADVSCIEYLSQNDRMVIDSITKKKNWLSKIEGIGSMVKCEAFVTSLRVLEPNVVLSEIILTPIDIASGSSNEMRIGISLLASGSTDR